MGVVGSMKTSRIHREARAERGCFRQGDEHRIGARKTVLQAARPPYSSMHPFIEVSAMLLLTLLPLACTTPAAVVVQRPLPDNEYPADVEDQFQPSFSCDRAKTSVERAICGDEDLSTLDVELNNIYDDIQLGAATSRVQGQQAWLAQRDGCRGKGGSDAELTDCIAAAYTSRLQELCVMSEPLCGFFVQSTTTVESPDFDGMSVVSISPLPERGVFLLSAWSIADDRSRVRCSADLWARRVGGELIAAGFDDDELPHCLAKLIPTRHGIKVMTSLGCQSVCGADAAWGGEYTRVATEAEKARWLDKCAFGC